MRENHSEGKMSAIWSNLPRSIACGISYFNEALRSVLSLGHFPWNVVIWAWNAEARTIEYFADHNDISMLAHMQIIADLRSDLVLIGKILCNRIVNLSNK